MWDTKGRKASTKSREILTFSKRRDNIPMHSPSMVDILDGNSEHVAQENRSFRRKNPIGYFSRYNQMLSTDQTTEIAP